MKYLNIWGFKAGEASCSCQQTDPLQPSRGPRLWPTTSSTCRSQISSSLFRRADTTRGKGRDSQMKLLLSPNTLAHMDT